MNSFGFFLCGTGLYIAGMVTGAAIAGCLALGYCWHEANGDSDHRRYGPSDRRPYYYDRMSQEQKTAKNDE